MLEVIMRLDGIPLVMFSGSKLAELRALLEANTSTILCIDSSRLDARDWTNFAEQGLGVLRDLPVKRLLLQGSVWRTYEGLGHCDQLAWLDVSNCLNFKFDLSELPRLKHLDLIWSKDVTGLSSLRHLESLRVSKFKTGSGDLRDFASLSKLRKLTVTQSNVESIRGIESLPRLADLTFTHNKILGFRAKGCLPMPQVTTLRIEKCPKVGLTFVKAFPNVVTLELFGQPELPTLKPVLNGLESLRDFQIGATKVTESDNRYWSTYSNIQRFVFQDMRHYTMKMKELEQLSGRS